MVKKKKKKNELLLQQVECLAHSGSSSKGLCGASHPLAVSQDEQELAWWGGSGDRKERGEKSISGRMKSKW